MKKVAICQDYISFGGRITVLIEIIRVLNDIGIEPDILTYQMKLNREDIINLYGADIQFKVIQLKGNPFRKLDELNKIIFNIRLRKYRPIYHLFIESNNTSCFLPLGNTLSYVHYPRIDRVLSKKSIHGENQKFTLKIRLIKYIDKQLARTLYRTKPVSPDHYYTFNSIFSRDAFLKYYDKHITFDKISVIYPPAGDDNQAALDKKKPKSIVSLGRFSPYKRQLEQIQIAENLPNFNLNIIGFKDPSGKYYNKCETYIKRRHLKNVKLYTGLDLTEVNKMLASAQFFIHATINEPFGITSVQAIRQGCIPIVSDSGGQKEIVPIDELRFGSLEEATRIFLDYDEKHAKSHVELLQQNAEQFSNSTFRKQIKEVLIKLIKHGE